MGKREKKKGHDAEMRISKNWVVAQWVEHLPHIRWWVGEGKGQDNIYVYFT